MFLRAVNATLADCLPEATATNDYSRWSRPRPFYATSASSRRCLPLGGLLGRRRWRSSLRAGVASRSTFGVAAHDNHWSGGVLHAVGAHRTHQHAREASVTMAADHEQVGLSGRV